mmetsp:Transcript_89230/g.213073  ORF Transcript_89230/g.213073 Transcript_89230/m.213073 type:complete len:207 (+) Transcript_89230:553-1173(+)
MMNRALLGFGAVGNANVALSCILHVVLVQQVIERFVQRIAVHHDQRNRLLHEALDTLKVHCHEHVAQVIREGAAKHDLGLAVVQEPALEEKSESCVVLCQQHQMPCVRLLEVLSDEVRARKLRYLLPVHARPLEELFNSSLQLFVRSPSEVSLHRLHQHLGFQDGLQSLRRSHLQLGVDNTHGTVELAHSEEVGPLLTLVDFRESF